MTPSIRELDVRPTLRNGGDPFQEIMGAVNALAPGQALKLFATFRPQPLLRVMASRGFAYAAREIAGGDWEVIFTPQLQSSASVETSRDAEAPETWPDPADHLDLTELEPPEPMTRILARIEEMQPGSVLFALLSRAPVFLFPELERRGHQWAGNFDQTGSTFRILIRAGSARG